MRHECEEPEERTRTRRKKERRMKTKRREVVVGENREPINHFPEGPGLLPEFPDPYG